MSEWRIEYDNDTGPDDEGFHEWWTVTDGSKSFRCDTESDANFLFDRLSEWKPIETAPKDGTRFVAFGIVRGEPGYTSDEAEAFFCRYVGGLFQIDQPTGRYFAGAQPTHWMPLPAPPVTD